MANISNKINQIDQKVNTLFKQIEGLEKQAKQWLQKSQQAKGSAKDMYKQKCLMALKKKKALENQMKNYNGHQNLLQQAAFTAENMNSQKQMYEQLKEAVTVQKEAMKNVDLDKMDDLRDQMMDIKMESEMMNEIMNKNYDMDYDEDQFQDDFMEFQKEIAKEKKQTVKNANNKQVAPNANNKMDLDHYLKDL